MYSVLYKILLWDPQHKAAEMKARQPTNCPVACCGCRDLYGSEISYSFVDFFIIITIIFFVIYDLWLFFGFNIAVNY